MSLSILNGLKEKYNVYILQLDELRDNLKNIICGIGSKIPFCFLVDDAFGTTNPISTQEIQNNKALQDLTTYIAQGKLKVIITMRKSICNELKGTLNRCDLLCDEMHMVDLTAGKFMISESAREDILLRYLENCPSIEIINTKDAHLDHAKDDLPIKITDFEVKQIFEGGVQKRSYIEGFPLACSRFIKKEQNLRRKVDFFQNNYRIECKEEVKHIRCTDKGKYSVLVYTLLKNGRFDMRKFDMDLMQKITYSLSLFELKNEDEIKSVARNDNYYLKKHTPWEYRFDHDIIFEVLLMDYGKSFPKEVISLNSSYRMVFELFRTKKEREDEVCLEIDGDMFPYLAQRLIREMKDANIYTVGGHAAMKDENFLPFFLEEIEKDEEARHFKSDLLASASIMSSPQLANVLLPLEDIPLQYKAFSFQVACWFGSDWLHLYMDYFRGKINETETQKVLANALLSCVEKGHIIFTKDILDMLTEEFLLENPKKLRTAFKLSCYFGQLDVAKHLHERHSSLGEMILQISDYRKAMCKAALKGSIATVKWLAEFEDMMDDETIVQVMKNACTFRFTRTAVFTARHFEVLRPHLKRKLRQLFHVRYGETKLPRLVSVGF
ncbi:hypothetical protein FSP39_001730 [Pinctada imbricata]|uniref:Novel STAND NTPase 3 domain-containing protein n=1 Tax=Pinctada imbricata TaxID=66713 RepID=A0AA88XFQ3_PINIB|nr:hypothetical protein FSP39_001730 [Pinctada imbricata]